MKTFNMLRLALVAGILANALILAPAQAASKTLVYCSEGSPAGFDPGQLVTGTDFDVAEAIYNRLVQFQRGTTQVEPGLAEKWDISPDNLTYTFHLRHGVKFQATPWFKPTRDFNADDVVFTFERMAKKNEAFAQAYPADFPYYTDTGLAADIDKVEKVDPYTVRFVLKRVDAPFIQNLALNFASILSAEYAGKLLKEGNARNIALQPVGTGPFMLRSYQKDAIIRFDANPDYWEKGDVKLDKLIFAITTDSGVRVQKLKAGECQVMSYPRPADLQSLKGDPKLKVQSQVGFNLGFLAYNTQHKPLDKLAVRQALDMAINKKVIIASVFQDAGQVAVAPMAPTQWSYDKNLKNAPYDPEKAKALLKRAGVNNLDITLWAMPVQRPYNPNARLMAEMIQADWAKIGVKARIVTYEWGEYIKRAKAGEHDTLLLGWTGDNGDPDNWLGVLLSCDSVNGNNFSRWCDKSFDDLLKQARATTNQAERIKLYTRAQEIFKQEIPFTPIAHSTQFKPMSKNVQGFKMSPLSRNIFTGVSLK